ncbi:hypothetical protein HBA92_16010 [Ochrobactrum sp. MR28]|uniref:Uncharacterized protein n=1 Tax=Brucella tritici TaxID=94626 RepID=A0A6L3Y5I7_9HYPH|nr:hypothetical protein [Brucella tritici]KAB2676519.1 hypothetical protein F9L08_26360 [Brucella tritici]MBX8802253.1 hypothetical protein [Ochrobactrum sp. MR28]MBX8818782.1 hypothetical protein [Ochrobactrum sp. MR31]
MKGSITVKPFEGIPVADEIEAGQAGVNVTLLSEIADNPPPKNKHWNEMFRLMVLNPKPDGSVPTNDELAEALGVFRDTVRRAKLRWQKLGLIYRVNYNGLYAYNPKLLVVKNRQGEVINLPWIDARAAEENAPNV